MGLGLLLALIASALAPASAWAAPDVVTVAQGSLRGAVAADHRAFLNVPFAAPPIGDLRFRPPRPAASWTGTRDATKAGPSCPQVSLPGGVSEDCLALNVYTPPAATSRNLPVMVWITGGAYVAGSGIAFDPTLMVTQGKVITVTINYRLGPFGFLALPGLADESGTTGNYGILDQQAALRWVRDNIRAFGGNPGNVTLFGESAGGHSVCMQMISPTAAGLFHKAISQSGGCVDSELGPVTTTVAYQRAHRAASALGCVDPATVVACLRGKPMDALLNAGQNSASPGGLTWVPTLDGKIIREPADDAIRAGRYNRVPLISGATKDEGRLFLGLFHHFGKFRRANTEDLVAEIALRNGGTATSELLAAYPPQAPDNADLALAQVTTDSGFSCPSLFLTRAALSQAGQKVFTYEFADPEPPYSNLDPFLHWGAYHGSEVYYLTPSLQGLPSLLNDAQKRLSRQMIGYWTTFARTGDPNAAGLPAWPAFTASSQQTQRLLPTGVAPFTTFATDHKCDLWGSV